MNNPTDSLNRRDFIKFGAAGLGMLMAGSLSLRAAGRSRVPSYLAGYEALYRADPRAASLAWFKDAKFGLFLHYGPYSILEGEWKGQLSIPAEWIQLQRKIPLAEYENVGLQFDPKNFDADFITDLALEAGMKYVNLTSKHHDSFCLFDTGTGRWDSVSTCGRDLCAEMAEQCQKKGLGCFFYYSLFADWRHPYFFPVEYFKWGRPDYDVKPAEYKFQRDEDFVFYINDCMSQLRLLLSNYGPLAGIWFDPVLGYYARPDLFPMDEIYGMIRQMQPQCLISAKQGATGQEDFIAPERSRVSMAERMSEQFGPDSIQARTAKRAEELNKGKLAEICDTLQPHSWGHNKADDGQHKSAADVMAMLEVAEEWDANLLLNTGPLPDGAIHPEDVATLRQVGRLRNQA